MEQLNKQKNTVNKAFIFAGLLLLLAGMIWGITGALQYLFPGLLKETLSFEKVRPLHVSSMIFWIIMAASGSVITYLQQHTGRGMYAPLLLRIQFLVFAISIVAILVSYFLGIFGGREYWEFHPLLAIPVVSGWILFLYNFFRTVGFLKNQPVYVWMWLTGIVFFLFTFLESYAWLIPGFRNNIVRDMTVQWKAYGSMVGSWNMLIYGSSIFLMDKITGRKTYSYSAIAFALYFTGLFNLMFNWGHHIYTLPTPGYVKHISYVVSMTELAILGWIIFKWRSSLEFAKKNFHDISCRFLTAADGWVFLTLILAIFMSIPGINIYTHGTHITVAHTMGATIGINTFILLAISWDVLGDTCMPYTGFAKMLNRGYWMVNISLLFFWISLIAAGILKAKWQMNPLRIPFSSMMLQLRPWFWVFFAAGTAMTVGFFMILYPLLKNYIVCYWKQKATGREKVNSNQIVRVPNTKAIIKPLS